MSLTGRAGKAPAEHPLSYGQERLWFLNRLDPADASYNIATIARLRGPLNVPALSAAFREIIGRHSIVRMRFTERDGTPVQVCGEWQGPWLERFDVSGARDPQAQATVIVAEHTNRPFDLTAGPLLRASVIRLADDDHVLGVVMHHIAGDGVSLGVLSAELAALYEAQAAGQPSPLAPLPMQYVDYVRRQREQHNDEARKQLLAYWAARLRGVPPLELPPDRPRARVRSLSGRQVTCPLPGELVTRLEQISRASRCTMFMTWLAAFQLLLARHTGEYDVCIGSPIAGREQADVEQLIGLFANTLALRGDLSGDPTFRELMLQTRAVALEAYVHQDVPFELLLNELDVERDLSRTPLFQTMFAMFGAEDTPLSLAGTESGPFGAGFRQAKIDLTGEIFLAGHRPRAVFTYNSDLYDEATIVRLSQRYITLLEEIAADPDARLSDLAVISPAERIQLVHQWNATAQPAPQVTSVAEMFAAQAGRTPDAPAACCQGRSASYAELDTEVDRLAHRLRRQGIGPGTLVAVCLERSLEMLTSLLAVLRTGGAYLPLDPGYPARRLEFILTDAAPAALLTQRRLLPRLPAHAARVILTDDEDARQAGEPDPDPAPSAGPEDLAYVIYTSGSTGRPKGVQVTQRALANLLHGMRGVLGPEPTGPEPACPDPTGPEPTGPDPTGPEPAGTWLATTSLSFDISGLELFLPIITGGQVAIATESAAADGAALLKVIEEQSVTHLQATPSGWQMLLEAGFRDPAMTALAGGEALPAPLARELRSRVRRLWNVYGPTETTIWSACWEVPETVEAVLVGGPIANTQIHLLDDRLRLVPVGVPGELYIGGAGLARGYLRRPGLTAARFVPDPFGPPGSRLYRTGDLARRRAQGEIEFLARVDNQVKLRGHRIELGEIEASLLAHPLVARAAVAMRTDGRDPYLAGYVVVTSGDPAPPPDDAELGGQLGRHCAASLPAYMVPGIFVRLDRLPLTPNGKLDRAALPVPDRVVPGPAAPLEGLAAQVADIWREVLRVDRIGLDDDLFDLGGHSLTITRIAARIHARLRVDVPLEAFYDMPTVAGIVAAIGELTTQD
ncbi:MAG: non-ribosomal peptide synthetase [Streptosporangiaceae bacterium]